MSGLRILAHLRQFVDGVRPLAMDAGISQRPCADARPLKNAERERLWAIIGIEEPENQLHPRLLPELTEECRTAAARTQLLVTTHSPFFINQLRPEEVWALYRDDRGYTQARRTADMRGLRRFVEEGALLGNLWTEGFFDVGDPLTLQGGRQPILRN